MGRKSQTAQAPLDSHTIAKVNKKQRGGAVSFVSRNAPSAD